MDTARTIADGTRPRLELRNAAAPLYRHGRVSDLDLERRRARRGNADLAGVPDTTIAALVATSLRGRVFELVGAFFAHEGCQEDPRPPTETGSLAAHARGAFSLRLISRTELEDLERIDHVAGAFGSSDGPRTFDDRRIATECARLETAPGPRDATDVPAHDTPRMRFLGAAQAIGEELERRSLRLANLGRSALELQ